MGSCRDGTKPWVGAGCRYILTDTVPRVPRGSWDALGYEIEPSQVLPADPGLSNLGLGGDIEHSSPVFAAAWNVGRSAESLCFGLGASSGLSISPQPYRAWHMIVPFVRCPCLVGPLAPLTTHLVDEYHVSIRPRTMLVYSGKFWAPYSTWTLYPPTRGGAALQDSKGLGLQKSRRKKDGGGTNGLQYSVPSYEMVGWND